MIEEGSEIANIYFDRSFVKYTFYLVRRRAIHIVAIMKYSLDDVFELP